MNERKRININIDTDIGDEDVVRRVLHVISEGFSFVTTWTDGVSVFAERNNLGNDTFWVQKEGEDE